MADVCQRRAAAAAARGEESAYVSIRHVSTRQHTSAYVRIRQHTRAYAPGGKEASEADTPSGTQKVAPQVQVCQ